MAGIGDWIGGLFKAPKASTVPKSNLLDYSQLLDLGAKGANYGAQLGYDQWNKYAPQIFGQTLGFARDARDASYDQWRKNDPLAAQADTAYKTKVNQLAALGGDLDADMQREAFMGALQGGAAAGMYATPGATGLVARDLGMRSNDLLNERLDRQRDVAFRFQPEPLEYDYGGRPDKYEGFGSSLMGAYGQNVESQNADAMNQFMAEEAVKDKDSFMGGLAKGLITRGTTGLFDTAAGYFSMGSYKPPKEADTTRSQFSPITGSYRGQSVGGQGMAYEAPRATYAGPSNNGSGLGACGGGGAGGMVA